MTDRKSSSQSSRRRRRAPGRRAGRRRYFGGLTAPGANMMVFTSRWQFGQLTSGTSGILSASSIAPTITSSSEYSIVGSMFTEVKLLAATVIISPQVNAGSSVTSGRLIMGTNMIANATTHASLPLAITDVQNLAKVRFYVLSQYNNNVFQYQMPVPRNLEFAGITQDAPVAPTPWAGSPGAVYVFANNLTVSTTYAIVDIQATWMLRGRQ